MSLLIILVFGLVVGTVARLIVPGKERGGWIASIALGVLGSFVGGYLGQLLGVAREERLSGALLSVAGAVLLLVAYNAFRGRAPRVTQGD